MKEGEEQDNPTLFEIMKDDPNITYNEATKVKEDIRLRNEASAAAVKKAGVCVTGALKKDLQQNRPLSDTMDEIAYNELKRENERLKKRVQEAEGETSIIKGIGMGSAEMKEARRRIKELENSLSIALEINENHQRYNGKLQTRVTDLEEDNKKLAHQVEDIKMNYRRKAGF